MKKNFKLIIEGFPGSGKTSSLVQLSCQLGPSFVMLSEINPICNLFNQTKNSWKFYHHMWRDRLKIINSSFNNYVFLMDRSYYSSLAFTYAKDLLLGENEFEKQKILVKKDFSKTDFDLIIILEVSTNTGLKRREENNDKPPWPWSDNKFLDYFCSFYKHELFFFELPKIIRINTENLSVRNVVKIIKDEIIKTIPEYVKFSPTEFDSTFKQQLLSFANKYNLGNPYSDVFMTLGYPTLYFRQHSIQLDSNIVVFLDNNRLSKLGKLFT